MAGSRQIYFLAVTLPGAECHYLADDSCHWRLVRQCYPLGTSKRPHYEHCTVGQAARGTIRDEVSQSQVKRKGASLNSPEATSPTSANARDNRHPTRVRYIVLAFLCAISFLTYFDRVCIVRAQADIQHDLALTNQQIALILSAFWLAYALFEIPSGSLGDRQGPRKTLTRIVLAWSVFTALSGMAIGFSSLLACRFLFGMGEAGAYPNIARIQSRWLPEQARARAGGLIWLVARWGGAFSPVILGAMLRLFNSAGFRRLLSPIPALTNISAWRLGFFASGFVGLTWCALFYPWFRDDPTQKLSVNQAELDLIREGKPPTPIRAGAHVPFTPELWKQLFTSSSIWGLAILYLCGSFGWSFFVSWMPRFLLDVHRITYEKSEWMSAAPMFFGGIACLLGGMLSDHLVRATGRKRLGRAIFPIIGCATAGFAMIAIRFVHTPHQAVIIMCITAAAYDFGQAANWASIIDIGGDYAGTACGLMNTVGNMGNVLQPVVGAWIFGHLGWGALFYSYAGAYFVAGSMWLFIDPRRKFHAERLIPLKTLTNEDRQLQT